MLAGLRLPFLLEGREDGVVDHIGEDAEAVEDDGAGRRRARGQRQPRPDGVQRERSKEHKRQQSLQLSDEYCPLEDAHRLRVPAIRNLLQTMIADCGERFQRGAKSEKASRKPVTASPPAPSLENNRAWDGQAANGSSEVGRR